MSARRQDFLGTECELSGMTIPEFTEAFCVRCSQPECSRSLFGTSKFDQRVQNWEKRLFTEVPRMNAEDPRFSTIAAQKFVSLGHISPAATSAWIDPKDVKEKSVLVPTAIEPAPPVVQPKPPRSLPVVNTPFQNGTMIGNAPAPKPTQESSWVSTVPEAKPKETIIKPGTKVKLGGGSGV